jgi:hypothetical protein
LFKRESSSASFGAKVAPCLYRADPSIMNSVTGSSYVAKCSNILQDTHLLLVVKQEVSHNGHNRDDELIRILQNFFTSSLPLPTDKLECLSPT